jgi:hypothetical protein
MITDGCGSQLHTTHSTSPATLINKSASRRLPAGAAVQHSLLHLLRWLPGFVLQVQPLCCLACVSLQTFLLTRCSVAPGTTAAAQADNSTASSCQTDPGCKPLLHINNARENDFSHMHMLLLFSQSHRLHYAVAHCVLPPHWCTYHAVAQQPPLPAAASPWRHRTRAAAAAAVALAPLAMRQGTTRRACCTCCSGMRRTTLPPMLAAQPPPALQSLRQPGTEPTSMRPAAPESEACTLPLAAATAAAGGSASSEYLCWSVAAALSEGSPPAAVCCCCMRCQYACRLASAWGRGTRL